MTVDQIVARVCARFNKQDDQFKAQVKAEILPAAENVILYDDWAFRIVEGQTFTFIANQTDVILPVTLHHLTALYRQDQNKIDWCDQERWADLNRDSTFNTQTPTLMRVVLVKDHAQGGNVMKLKFGPKAAGGEVVYYSYAQQASVTSLENVPLFLHEAVCLKVIAEMSSEIVSAAAGNTLLSNVYDKNIKRYEAKIQELWRKFSTQPANPFKIQMDEAVTNFRRATRRQVGV